MKCFMDLVLWSSFWLKWWYFTPFHVPKSRRVWAAKPTTPTAQQWLLRWVSTWTNLRIHDAPPSKSSLRWYVHDQCNNLPQCESTTMKTWEFPCESCRCSSSSKTPNMCSWIQYISPSEHGKWNLSCFKMFGIISIASLLSVSPNQLWILRITMPTTLGFNVGFAN
jgi:hypothetical protein